MAMYEGSTLDGLFQVYDGENEILTELVGYDKSTGKLTVANCRQAIDALTTWQGAFQESDCADIDGFFRLEVDGNGDFEEFHFKAYDSPFEVMVYKKGRFYTVQFKAEEADSSFTATTWAETRMYMLWRCPYWIVSLLETINPE